MERILVAVDRTSTAEVVLRYAVALARAAHAKVGLCHVVTLPAPLPPPPGGLPVPNITPHLVDDASSFLELLRDQVPLELRETSYVELGTPADQICTTARAFGADLVVLGAHEHGALARALGTTAARIVNRLDRPALVVRPRETHAKARRILVALDESEVAATVLDHAIAFARVTGSRLRLLRAVCAAPSGDDMADLLQHQERVPRELRDGTSVVFGEEPAGVICEQARSCEADALVIGAHRYGLLERVLGTTAAKVVDLVDRPALIVHPVAAVARKPARERSPSSAVTR
jgi:nucleotide-binding universal stress UspA family protein